MQQSILQLENILEKYTPLLQNVNEQTYSYKPLKHKWSKRELIGHMIDSAQNNIRRFVVAQYESKPEIRYMQDHWVAAADYQHYPVNDMIQLWLLLNKHIVHVLKNVPADMQQNEVLTEKLHSIEWLAADYNTHLLHHLHQVLEMEEVAYP